MKELINKIKTLKSAIEKDNEEWKLIDTTFEYTQREVAIGIWLKLNPAERALIRDITASNRQYDFITNIVKLMNK